MMRTILKYTYILAMSFIMMTLYSCSEKDIANEGESTLKDGYISFVLYHTTAEKNGIETSSHSGCRQKFGQLFVQNGKISKDLAKLYTDLFEKRQKGDYNDFFDFDRDTVRRLYEPSKLFIQKIEELINESH